MSGPELAISFAQAWYGSYGLGRPRTAWCAVPRKSHLGDGDVSQALRKIIATWDPCDIRVGSGKCATRKEGLVRWIITSNTTALGLLVRCQLRRNRTCTLHRCRS